MNKLTLAEFGREITKSADTLKLSRADFLSSLLVVAAWLIVRDDPEQTNEEVIEILSDEKMLTRSIDIARDVDNIAREAGVEEETVH